MLWYLYILAKLQVRYDQRQRLAASKHQFENDGKNKSKQDLN
jgi:hypothetical protein